MPLISRPHVLAAALAALVVAAGAQAAEQIALASLGELHGRVMVNQGKGFVAARSGMVVNAGDRVIALDGAAAQILYKDGCVTSLKEHNLLPIDARGCAAQPLNPQAEVLKLAQAVGGTRPDAPPSDRLPANKPPFWPETPWAQVATGAGLVLAAGLIMGGIDNKPISAR